MFNILTKVDKSSETRRNLHTHTHTHTCNLLLSPKQIGTICFAKFFRFCIVQIFSVILLCQFCIAAEVSGTGEGGTGISDLNYPFTLTTTSLGVNDTFKFGLSAAGTFYVDCGDGGTLSGNGASSGTFIKTNTTYYEYACTYSTGGAKTIRFGGTATEYASSNVIPVMKFNYTSRPATFYYPDANASKVASIDGNLSGIFPEINGHVPNFGSMFYACTNITSLPENLFSSYTIARNAMFMSTFSNCTSLTGYIPASMFAGLIANGLITQDMWTNTFKGTQLATTCPSGTIQVVTGYELYWNGKVACGPDGTGGSTGGATVYAITLRNYNDSHSTIYEKYNTGWYSDGAATTSMNMVTVPTRDGYTFRGFYTAQQSDLIASGGSGTRRITNTGVLPANNTFSSDTNLYAAWARNCNQGAHCTCSLTVNNDGTVTYTTSAQTGYTLTSDDGTYHPVCTPEGNSADNPTTPVSCITPGKYWDGTNCVVCENNHFCPGNGNHYPCPLGGNSTSLDGKSCSVNVTKTKMESCWRYSNNASLFRDCVYGIHLEDYLH